MKEKKVKDYIHEIQQAQDVSELYNAQIQLELLKGELFKKRGDGNHEDVGIMADISLATTLQEVCRERLKDLQEKNKAEANKEQQYAYNFLRNSEYFIDRETFDKISESALIPRSTFRARIIKERGSLEKMKLKP